MLPVLSDLAVQRPSLIDSTLLIGVRSCCSLLARYNHAAIWKHKPELWPRSFYTNGHVMVRGSYTHAPFAFTRPAERTSTERSNRRHAVNGTAFEPAFIHSVNAGVK